MNCLSVALLMGSLGALVLASQSALRISYKLSSFFRITAFARAFVVAAFVISIPEFFIGIGSALNGVPLLSLGNILGANVLDLSIVSGIALIVSKHFNPKSRALRTDSAVMAVMALLPVVLALVGGGLSRADGFLLILSFFAYVHVLWVERKDYHKHVSGRVSLGRAFFYSAALVLCLFVMLCASFLVVSFGAGIASSALPVFVIGLILVSLGTSIPEFSFVVSSFVLDSGDLSLGGVAGAVAVNSSLIIGLVAVVSPFAVAFSQIFLPVVFLALSLLLFILFVECCSAGARGGVVLVMVYLLFLVSQIYKPF